MKMIPVSFLAVAVAAAIYAQPPGVAPNSVRVPASETPATVTPGNSSTASPGAAVQPVAAPSPDGLAIVGHRLFLVRDGQATLQDRTLNMTISADGLTGFDGHPVVIPQGFMVSMQGRLIPIPDNVTGLPVGLPSGTSTGLAPTPTTPATISGAVPARPPVVIEKR